MTLSVNRLSGINMASRQSRSVSPKLVQAFGNTSETTPVKKEDFFCRTWKNQGPSHIIAQNQSAFSVLDGYPVATGHALIVPKRHVASFFDTTPQEKADLLALLETTRNKIQEATGRKGMTVPTDFNIGINDGRLAGRTVDHLHVHLIPRYTTDMASPEGGVRGVVPDKQKYSGPPDPKVDDLFTTT